MGVDGQRVDEMLNLEHYWPLPDCPTWGLRGNKYNTSTLFAVGWR